VASAVIMTNSQATELDYFWAALMFYTRIPVPSRALHSQEILNKSRKYFSMIGVVIASIAAVTFLLADLIFEPTLSIALSMVASILATGAFHEDGFADTCDGFGGGWEREQVLSIMKDSRIGTYGSLGLTLLLGVKFLTLLEISKLGGTLSLLAIFFAAHTLSRTLSSSAIDLFDYVQDPDVSKVKPMTEQNLSSNDRWLGILVTSLATMFLVYLSPGATLLSILIACLTALIFMIYSRHKIGGYTGDVLGATQQLSEVGFYLCFAACL